MIYFFDKSLQLQKIVTSENITAGTHEQELNGIILSDIVLDIDYAKFLVLGIDRFGYYHDGVFHLHRITRVEYVHENDEVFIFGRHVFFDDMLGYNIIQDFRPQNRDAAFVLRNTIESHTRWQVVSTDTTKHHTQNFYYQLPMEVLNTVVEEWGIEYEPRILFDGQNINAFLIHVAERIGEDTPIRVPFGDRVLNLKHEIDYSEISTAVIGRGKGEEVGDGYGRRIEFEDIDFSRNGVISPPGQKWMENPDVTAVYGYDDGQPKFEVVVFDQIEDVDDLVEATYEHYLNVSRPKMLFESSVRDLGNVKMGDSVLIIRRERDVYFRARIHKISVDLIDPAGADVELGDYEHFKDSKVARRRRNNDRDYKRQTSSRIERLKREWDAEFESIKQQWISEFEQAVIDSRARVEAAEQRMNDRIDLEFNNFHTYFDEAVDQIYADANLKYLEIEQDITGAVNKARDELEIDFNREVDAARTYAYNQAEAHASAVQTNLSEFEVEHQQLYDGVINDISDQAGIITDINEDLNQINLSVTGIEEDYVKQSSVIIREGSIQIGSASIGGTDMASMMTFAPTGIDIIAQSLRISADMTVAGDIEAISMTAVEAEFSSLWAAEFAATTITADHIDTDTLEFSMIRGVDALIERMVARTAFVDELSGRELYFSEGTVGRLETAILRADVIENRHLKSEVVEADNLRVDNAMVNKLFVNDLLVQNIESMSLDVVRANINDLRTDVLISDVVDVDHIRWNNALFNRLTGDEAFIDRLEVKAANIRDLSAIHIRGGMLDSLNNNLRFNLNTGHMSLLNTNFELGGSAKITFTNRNNRLEYSNRSITAGMQFDHSLGSDGRPMTAVGVSDGAFDVNDSTFRGLIVHSLGTEGLLGYGSSIITQDGGFYTRTDRTGSGINFRLHATGSGAPRGIYPQYTGTYDYNLGSALNPWAQAYIRDVRTSGQLWIRDWNGTGGWHVGTIAESGRTTITLRGVSTNLWNYNLGSGTYRMNNIYLNNSPNVSSDERLKEDIKSTDLGLDFINGIEIKSFRKTVKEADINESRLKNHLEFGVIAQQLRDNLISHGVDTEDIAMLSIDDDGYYGVQHEQLIAPTIKAVQEVNAKVESNTEKIARLEKEIELLKGA